MTSPQEANRGPRRPDFLVREVAALRRAFTVLERRVASYSGEYARPTDIPVVPVCAVGFEVDGDQLTVTFSNGTATVLTLPTSTESTGNSGGGTGTGTGSTGGSSSGTTSSTGGETPNNRINDNTISTPATAYVLPATSGPDTRYVLAAGNNSNAWFTWTAPANGTLTISSSTDASSAGALFLDNADGSASIANSDGRQISAAVAAGTTYAFRMISREVAAEQINWQLV